MSQINIDTSKYYAIIARHSGYCLDVEDASLESGAKVIQYKYRTKNNQMWKLKPTGDGHYNIVAKHSSKCLTAPDPAELYDEEIIRQFDCDNSQLQKWQIISLGPVYYKVISVHSGECLDASGSSSSYDPVIPYKYNGGNNQQWRLIPANEFRNPKENRLNKCPNCKNRNDGFMGIWVYKCPECGELFCNSCKESFLFRSSCPHCSSQYDNDEDNRLGYY